MIDWTKSMQQSFEYYEVDPSTWKDKKLLTNVKSSTINRDSTVDTLGSATIDVTESVGECYIRTYLIVNQNGATDKIPLGTHLVQTPSSSFNGKIRNVSMDAYTPLLELKENSPPIGYFIDKDQNAMERLCAIVQDNTRVPLVGARSNVIVQTDFVADPNDTWLSYCKDLAAYAKYQFDLDELGRILFSPKQDTASLQPVWEYTDDNSSILYPEVTMDHDLFNIPNVVEVIYSKNKEYIRSVVTNDDPNSPTSTINRGRKITHRISDPDGIGDPTQEQLNEYAESVLRSLSSVEYTITYTHGYCPVRLGDCVLLNYTRAGLTDIKAKVISQTIECKSGCKVTEKAVFTSKLWR